MDKRPNYTSPHYNYPPPYGAPPPPNPQYYHYNFPPLTAPGNYPVPPARPYYEFHHTHFYANSYMEAGPSSRPPCQQYPFWQLYKPAPANSNASAGYIEYPSRSFELDTYQPIPLPSDVKKKKENESKIAAFNQIFEPDYYEKIQQSVRVMVLTAKQNEDLVNFQRLMCQPNLDYTEIYTKLPVSLFPKAKSVSLDPNIIIDEFCIDENTIEYDWILDIEFGLINSRKRQTAFKNLRPYTLPIFDVNRHSIQCFNDLDIIHPGFDKCSESFKRKMMIYYSIIVSYWYKGYIITAQDQSLDNFQAWLSTAMLTYGMCWP